MAVIPWAPGLKKTKQRQLVLEILERAEQPMAAPEISSRLERQGTPVWLSTVYRVLEQFVEHGMLHKTTVLENGMAVYEACNCQSHHRHYAVCLQCNKIIPIANCPMDSFLPQLPERFTVTGHRLQLYGICAGCGNKQPGESPF